jgi:hypothetical protein
MPERQETGYLEGTAVGVMLQGDFVPIVQQFHVVLVQKVRHLMMDRRTFVRKSNRLSIKNGGRRRTQAGVDTVGSSVREVGRVTLSLAVHASTPSR